MKYALVSKSLDGSTIAHELVREGHSVYVWSPKKAKMLPGFQGVNRVNGTLIDFIKRNRNLTFIFDGQDFGALQSKMRQKGLKVIGSGLLGEKIEADRMIGVNIAQKLGIQTPETYELSSIKETISFIKKNPKKYIVKQNGNLPKTLNWTAFYEDSHDIIDHLEAIQKKYGTQLDGKLVIQELIEGENIGVAAWWNGKDWMRTKNGIIKEINIQHKRLLNGNRGVSTGEQGTSMMLTEEPDLIFDVALRPLEGLLERTNYVGAVDADVIYNDKGIYLCEHTLRFGYPATSLYNLFTNHKLAEFFNMIVSGNPVIPEDFLRMDEKSVIVVVAFPTYPYEEIKGEKDSFIYERLYFDALTKEEMNKMAFCEVGVEGSKYYVSGSFGYSIMVYESGKTFKEANKKALSIIEKIIPSKYALYRTDIGEDSDERLERYKNYKPKNLPESKILG